MKTCSKCNETGDTQEFSPQKQSRDGLSSWCKKCKRELAGAYRLNKGLNPRKIPVMATDAKECLSCHKIKQLANFYPSKRGRLNRSAYCSQCTKDQHKSDHYRSLSRSHTRRYRERHKYRWRALHRINQFKRRKNIDKLSTGTVTDLVLESIYKTKVCHYCGKLTPVANRTCDHIVALNKGGLHDQANLTMACRSCNSSKRDLNKEEFINDRIKNNSRLN